MNAGEQRRVLGIDPGLAYVGWGVIAQDSRAGAGRASFRLIDCGCLQTTTNMPHAERLLHVFHGLGAVIAKHRPTAAAVEEVFQGKSPKSALLAGEGRGACILAAATHDLTVVEYPATVVKQAVTGNGRAVKQQVQSMVQRLLALDELPTPHHAADALAIAITHLQRGPRSGVVRG
ncbi:MAG: crossover junction endodeoxyribonuclease RuvC [Planctomycetota bacterium]